MAALAITLLLSDCASLLVPAAPSVRSSRREHPDDALLSYLHADYERLRRPCTPKAEREKALRRYNGNLHALLQRLRRDGIAARDAGKKLQIRGFQVSNDELPDGITPYDIYDDFIPAAEVPLHELEDRYTQDGLGVPMVGIIPAEKVKKDSRRVNIEAKGTVSIATAVLEFPAKGSPILRLVPILKQDSFRIGNQEYPLAADVSAALEVYANLTQLQKGRFLGMLKPQELRDVTGLSCLGKYDPNKIPVILTHGILSSANTFHNLVNRLMADPDIRRHYQFWYFNYPTGVAWTISAGVYRDSLKAVRKRLDPQQRNKNWDRMVVIGHSMGGLITHYSQCTEPWELLRGGKIPETLLHERYINTPFPKEPDSRMRRTFFFRPVKAGMVVYMATPHRGSPLAKYRIVNTLMKLVQLPQNLITEVISIATLQQDILLLNPANITEWFTSANQLDPDSFSIRGLRGMQVRNVPTHSIIGDRGRGNTPHSSDGIVPYWSSHIPWGTESIVPAGHSVQKEPETAEDLTRVLKQYLSTYKH